MGLDNLLISSIRVLRKTPAKDLAGGQVESFAVLVGKDNLTASVQPTDGKAMLIQGQRQVLITHRIYIKDVSEIQRGDVIQDNGTGKRFVVHGVEDMAGRSTVGRIQCVEIS